VSNCKTMAQGKRNLARHPPSCPLLFIYSAQTVLRKITVSYSAPSRNVTEKPIKWQMSLIPQTFAWLSCCYFLTRITKQYYCNKLFQYMSLIRNLMAVRHFASKFLARIYHRNSSVDNTIQIL